MSKTKHTFYFRPDGKSFNWEKKTNLLNLPRNLISGKRYKVTVEPYVPFKSLSQLRYYRGPVLEFLEKELYEDTGLTKNEWHDVLKDKFGIKLTDKTGQFEAAKSHANYSEKEMSLFIQQVIDWAYHYFTLIVPGPTEINEYL